MLNQTMSKEKYFRFLVLKELKVYENCMRQNNPRSSKNCADEWFSMVGLQLYFGL